MEDFVLVRNYICSGVIPPNLSAKERYRVRISSKNFIIKDDRLFYTGPKRSYMRLVVMTEEEKRAVLLECHDNPGTGNHHGVRGTRNRVIAGYYWKGIDADVNEWVRCCHPCQLTDPIKTQAPVLHSIKVNEPWDVVGLDLIGPLKTTASGNVYMMTMTDLFTKWVTAEPLRSKTAAEVSAAIVKTMYTFGMVRKVITDQGKEFCNELNKRIFEILKIKHSVSSAYHPQTNGQDERTNQNIKRALRKYVNATHDDWDVHLPAVIYGINTALQASTRHTPYFLMFHRQPRLPEVMNACPLQDGFGIADPEEDLTTTLLDMKVLNEEVLNNIQSAQQRQKKSYQNRRRNVRICHIKTGDDVLISKTTRHKLSLAGHHHGPYTVSSITPKGLATVVKSDGTKQQLSLSRLRPYYRMDHKDHRQAAVQHDHQYLAPNKSADHQYACLGRKWDTDLNPLQDELLKYILDTSRPAGELIVKEEHVCLIREEFWSLGLSRCMDSNIGNACLTVVKDTALKHGKDVHIVDLFVVPTWKATNVDPLVGLPVLLLVEREIIFLDSLLPGGFGDEAYRTIFRKIAHHVHPGQWKERYGSDFDEFPQQTSSNHCGVFMLMYALCICTAAPFNFSERDMTSIRKWWCVQLMERFSIEGHGKRFAFWTEEAKTLLAGGLEPLLRLPRNHGQRKSLNEPQIIKDLHLAVQWLQSNAGLFTGVVDEPSFLTMSEEEQQEALRVVLEEGDEDSKQPFLFRFEEMEDMEVFLQECWDQQGLHVNCMCTDPQYTITPDSD